VKSRPKRLFAAVVLAVLAALVLALPAISVTPAAETTTSSNAKALATLKASLTGEQEVDPVTGELGAGDPDGSGSAVVKVFRAKVCYTLEVEGIELVNTSAHIHLGLRGENGPVVADLKPQFTDGSASACVDIPRALSLELREHPSRYYVNVHNAEFPDGAIRGQLHKRR
jgi:hypothetical protein